MFVSLFCKSRYQSYVRQKRDGIPGAHFLNDRSNTRRPASRVCNLKSRIQSFGKASVEIVHLQPGIHVGTAIQDVALKCLTHNKCKANLQHKEKDHRPKQRTDASNTCRDQQSKLPEQCYLIHVGKQQTQSQVDS